MKFMCDRCQKRFSTTDEPVPGRVYRIPCRCGNTIVVQLKAAEAPVPRAAPIAPIEPPPRRAAPPPLPVRAAVDAPAELPRPPAVAAALGAQDAAIADDPFARAASEGPDLNVLLACASEEVTPTILARRDPDAPIELSSAYASEPTVYPFADELRRTRTHALALGGAAGAAVGAFCAAVVTLVLLRPWSPVAADTPGPSGDVSVAQLSSHRGPERPVAARRAPARAAAPSVAAVATQPRAPVAPAPPAPAPAASSRGDGAIAPASLESPRAPELIEATADPASEPARDRLDARAEPVAPAERPEATVEDAPAAAPADAPPVLDKPAPSSAISVEAQAHAPAGAPALEREP